MFAQQRNGPPAGTRIHPILIPCILAAVLLSGCQMRSSTASPEQAGHLRTGGNPVIDEGSADPSVRVFGGRVYIYPSHDFSVDNTFWIMKDWKVWSSTDLVNFADHGVVLQGNDVDWSPDPDHCWAPDCAEKDGHFYFYFPAADERGKWRAAIGVAEGVSPGGPFHDALGRPLIGFDDAPSGYEGWLYNIDPAAFTDDDGRSYLFWGNGNCFVAELGADMVSLASQISNVDIEGNKGYAEGPFVWKRQKRYYLLYSRTGSNGFDVLDYGISDRVTGPYQYAGTIIGHGMKGNEHGSVFEYRGQWYVAYHDLFPTDKYRKTCIEILHFSDDGTIRRATPGREGVGWYNAAERIEAEDYFEKSTGLRYREQQDGGLHIDRVTSGTWLKFPNVRLSYDFTNRCSARVASGSEGGRIEVVLDSLGGMTAGSLDVEGTGGWDRWEVREAELKAFDGIRDVYLKFSGGNGPLLSLDWFMLR